MKTLFSIIVILIALSIVASHYALAQTSQYDFKIWPADQWKAPGFWETMQGKICPTPVPDSGTNSTVKIYFTLPPWAATVAGTPYFLKQETMLPACNQSSNITAIRPNYTGAYPVYAIAQWTENGKTHTVQSNTTQFLAIEPCPAAYVMDWNKPQYHPGDVIPIKISSPVSGCKHLPVPIQITVYNYTGNTRGNILYQESRQIVNDTLFNYTVPKWTDKNGIFPLIVSTTWPDRNLTGEYSMQYLSSDSSKIPKSYNLTMWVNPSSFTNDGSGTQIDLKTCPFTPATDDNRQEKRDPVTGLIADPGSNILVNHHITLPDGTAKVQQYEMAPLADCNTMGSGQHLDARTIGTWSVYDTVLWVWENSTHELRTKPVNFTVTPALYHTTQLEEIDTKKIFSQLGSNDPSSQYIDLLDWSRDGKSVLFEYGVNLGTMSPDGKNVTRLDIQTNFAHIDRARFLPGGDSVIILAGKPSGAFSNLYKYSLNDKTLHQITNSSTGELITSFAVTPDGNLVYGSETISSTGDYLGFDMWLASPDGTKTNLYEKLFDPSVRHSKDFDGRDHFYVQDVSNDGKKILVYITYSTGWFEIHSSTGIFDIKTKMFDSRFTNFGVNQRLTPTGDLVIYVMPTGDKTPGGPMELVSTDNSYHEVLHSGESLPGDYPTSFVISPDGKYILSKIQPWSYQGQKIFRMDLAQPVPEFSLAPTVLVFGIMTLVVFHRVKFGMN